MLPLDKITRYHGKTHVDLHLSPEDAAYYRVFMDPPISDHLMRSISMMGISNPLRIYTNGVKAVLRDGHHRLGAAQKLGLATVPVHIVPDSLETVYDSYILPDLDPIVGAWVNCNKEFRHEGHIVTSAALNSRRREVRCSCGADWREVSLPV